MAPYLLSFALACAILSTGLLRRYRWMWYLGWAIFYLFAAYFGTFFFGALYAARDSLHLTFSLIYLLGGLVLWMPCIIWWSSRREYFSGPRKRLKAAAAHPTHRGPN